MTKQEQLELAVKIAALVNLEQARRIRELEKQVKTLKRELYFSKSDIDKE